MIERNAAYHQRRRRFMKFALASGAAALLGWPSPGHADDLSKDRYAVSQVFRRGDPDRRRLYLTLDDWWYPRQMENILQIAQDFTAQGYPVHLTLFPVGSVMAQIPDLLDQADRDGHSIQNHTQNHLLLSKQTDARIRYEMQSTQETLNSVLGREHKMIFVRPPGGDGIFNYDPRIPSIAADLKMKVVMWNVDSNGWRVAPRTDPGAISYILSNISYDNGNIVLQHGNPNDIIALVEVIRQAWERQFECASLEEGLE